MDLGLLEQYARLSQPTAEDQRKALQMGLLSAGMGMLAANNSRNLAPALGKGGLAGISDYQQNIEAAPAARMRNAIAGMQIHKFNEDVKRQQAIQAMGPQFTDQGAQMLLAGGNLQGAVDRQFPKQQEYNLRPGEQRMRGNEVVASLPKDPEAPKTRTVRMGGEDVTQEFNPKTMQWAEVGRGLAFNPRQPTTTVDNFPAR